jgi:hypothetical protein
MRTWMTRVHQEQLGCDMDFTFHVTSSAYIWGLYLLSSLSELPRE